MENNKLSTKKVYTVCQLEVGHVLRIFLKKKKESEPEYSYKYYSYKTERLGKHGQLSCKNGYLNVFKLFCLYTST